MKYSSFFLVILMVSFLLTSCNETGQEPLKSSNDFQGFWESVEDRENAPFGVIEIVANNDSLQGTITYDFAGASSKMKRKDSGQPFQGQIGGESSQITLLGPQKQAVGKAELKIVNDTLIYSVMPQGATFPSQRFVKRTAQATKTIVEEGNNANRWDALRQKGVDFLATGNEPFWSVEMNMKGSIKFTSLSEPDLFEVPVPKPEYPVDGSIVRYFSNTEAGMIDLVIQQMPCTDNMSGAVSPAFVTVKVRIGEREALNLEGCGRFLGDTRLNGTWRLKRIGEQALVESQFTRGLPTLKIALNEGELSGMGSCNNYSASFAVGNGHLVVGPVMATKMSCERMETETVFFNILSEQQLKYGFGAKELILQSRNGSLMFEK
jgi:heat shock protein HslJ